MALSPPPLTRDAIRIWKAGIAAVQPEEVLPRQVQVTGNWLLVGDSQIDLTSIRRIAVVGGGKAGTGMVRGLERALGERVLAEKRVAGWVNVPSGTVAPTSAIPLHVGRPAGVNEPCPEGVRGTREILRQVADLGPDDLCICLLSGGGSALMTAPTAGVTLEETVRVTRLLSAAGATIDQLNTVRRQICDIKGGGLARACNAGQLVTLIISDVLGDPLETIASGPTVESGDGPIEAIEVFSQWGLTDHPDAQRVVDFLHHLGKNPPGEPASAGRPGGLPAPRLHHVILANNATAVDAAGMEAERLGYRHAMICEAQSEGPAEEVGRHLAEMALTMRGQAGPNCLISGGEPTVSLAPLHERGKGGRNQQLVLAALKPLSDCHGIALLAGGTDGEDGPTDAAGAWVDEQVARRAKHAARDAEDHLRRNDAYPFFESVESLLQTGPTGTNVCDVRVVVVDQAVDQRKEH